MDTDKNQTHKPKPNIAEPELKKNFGSSRIGYHFLMSKTKHIERGVTKNFSLELLLVSYLHNEKVAIIFLGPFGNENRFAYKSPAFGGPHCCRAIFDVDLDYALEGEVWQRSAVAGRSWSGVDVLVCATGEGRIDSRKVGWPSPLMQRFNVTFGGPSITIESDWYLHLFEKKKKRKSRVYNEVYCLHVYCTLQSTLYASNQNIWLPRHKVCLLLLGYLYKVRQFCFLPFVCIHETWI